MTKALYIIALIVLVAAGFGIYWYNLSECMTQFSTFYCVTQVH